MLGATVETKLRTQEICVSDSWHEWKNPNDQPKINNVKISMIESGKRECKTRQTEKRTIQAVVGGLLSPTTVSHGLRILLYLYTCRVTKLTEGTPELWLRSSVRGGGVQESWEKIQKFEYPTVESSEYVMQVIKTKKYVAPVSFVYRLDFNDREYSILAKVCSWTSSGPSASLKERAPT